MAMGVLWKPFCYSFQTRVVATEWENSTEVRLLVVGLLVDRPSPERWKTHQNPHGITKFFDSGTT